MKCSRSLRLLLATLASAWILLADAVVAGEPMRIWVDADALYSIEARLIETRKDEVELLRKDGGLIVIAIDMLSEQDKQYLEDTGEQVTSNDNPLRGEAPDEPQITALPTLALPPATHVAENRALLEFIPRVIPQLPTELPGKLEADRSPIEFSVSEMRIPIDGADMYDDFSRPFPIGSIDSSAQSLAVSICDRTEVPGEKPNYRLIQFDLEAKRSMVKFRHFERIRLLDHHLESGRSLVLTGYDSIGQGGQFALVTGWDERIELTHRRKLTDDQVTDRLPVVRWAQWIDEEHFLAIIDRSLGLWNLVSGKQFYGIHGVDHRAIPSLSGGRRYLALPYDGGVRLFATETGKPLGRIGVEKQIPGVSFSPHGNTLAISTSRRMRLWDLPSATLAADFECRGELGGKSPTWVDFDLILSGTGTLLSSFRGQPIWKYDVAATESTTLGDHVVMLRRHPTHEISIVSLPHAQALKAMEWIDDRPADLEQRGNRVLGRSMWRLEGWVDRDVQISAVKSPQHSR